MEKYNEIQLTKNKMDFIILKITNPPPSLECPILKASTIPLNKIGHSDGKWFHKETVR